MDDLRNGFFHYTRPDLKFDPTDTLYAANFPTKYQHHEQAKMNNV